MSQISPSPTLPTPSPLQARLLEWYARHARPLPWRASRDPYAIWISEVILQQTQVVRGTAYYRRFLERFPSVEALASGPLEDVLKAWEGCGYYARARNLHKAAQRIVASGQGMPGTLEGWRALEGVGAYTAAAVTSIAYGLPHAVVDGNVRRVLARLYAHPHPLEPWLWQQAEALLVREDPGAWNQAVMELGATVCTPQTPDCPACPVRDQCAGFATGHPTDFPAPRARPSVRVLEAVALLIGDGQALYLERRPDKGLLGGLYGLPLELLETGGTGGEEAGQAALARLSARLGVQVLGLLGTVSHTMTHRVLTVHVYQGQGPLALVSPQEKALSRLDHKALGLLEGQGTLF